MKNIKGQMQLEFDEPMHPTIPTDASEHRSEEPECDSYSGTMAFGAVMFILISVLFFA